MTLYIYSNHLLSVNPYEWRQVIIQEEADYRVHSQRTIYKPTCIPSYYSSWKLSTQPTINTHSFFSFLETLHSLRGNLKYLN